ncbi:hypothetical protein BHQ21_26255 [Mycobacterium sherrisii]|uniref:Uncharacterized protein n=1 Tax=Mycobacterium sherrisii TaxID=243061 RepID=A0A1E3S5V3_9MYCO|nr:hypothetical protein BHQ21_26255 [Mycobacterium sherrisii]
MSTARRGAALGRWAQNFPLATSRNASFSSSASTQQPLEPGVLLAQLLEFLGGIGVHPAVDASPVVQRRRSDTQFGGDLLAVLTLSGQLIRAAQLAHDVLRGMPFATSHVFHRPFRPDLGP